MEDLEFDKNLQKAITAEERKLQKAYLQSLESSLGDKNQKKKFNWRVAASIAVLVGLGSYFLLFNSSTSNEDLYDTYFYPYENIVAPIVRDQGKLSKKAAVFSQYEQGNYKNAIDGFNQLSTKDSIDIVTINFYKANAYLQLNEFEKAQNLFYQIVEIDDKEWKQESIWYLALISLKLDDVVAAKKYLQQLKNQHQHTFKSKEVKDLINTLH